MEVEAIPDAGRQPQIEQLDARNLERQRKKKQHMPKSADVQRACGHEHKITT